MGAKKNDIRIEFNWDNGIPAQFSSEDSLRDSLVKFFHKQEGDNLTTPDITIVDFEVFDIEVQFTLYSSRSLNLDFQTKLLEDFMASTFDDDLIIEFNQDVWSQV